MKKTLLFTTALIITIISNATTITVTNTDDTGGGSLRDAIGAANNGDTIRFNPTLISAGSDTITLASEIAFSRSLTITGLYNATDTLYISGNNNSRIFSIINTTNVTLDSLVLINGNGGGAIDNGNGGALLFTSSDSLIIINTIIRDNSANSGGGVFCFFSTPLATLQIINSNISYNSTTNLGGGIFYTNTIIGYTPYLTVVNSIFNSNTAGSIGGGIYSQSQASFPAIITVESSAFIANTGNNGGGIFTRSSLLSISTSTFYNNTANSNGGGVFLTDANSTGSISNSTFNMNTAGNNGGGFLSGSFPLTITGSTFTDNFANSGTEVLSTANNQVTVGSSIFSDGDFLAPYISLGYNVFGGIPSSAVATDQTNITSFQLNLGTLSNNGGATQTLLPGLLSTAYNMGNPSDFSNAQNDTIYGGRRESGAAENCATLSRVDTVVTACNYLWAEDGNTYNKDTIVYVSIGTNASGCDSLVALMLTINPITDQSLTATVTNVCYTSNTTITTSSSDLGLNYYLRNNANDTIIDGPLVGTGSGLSFNTGALTSNMTYNVFGEDANAVTSNSALNFAGNLEQVTVPNNAAFEFTTGTIECWLKPDASSDDQAFVAIRDGSGSRFSLHINENSNQILIYSNAFGAAFVTVTGGITPNTWYHVAIVMKNANSEIYVNGILQGTILPRIDVSKIGLDFAIGSSNVGSLPESFTGDIDEVRVWNVERTATEISTNYLGCLAGTETGLVAYYNFESGTSALLDLTVNGFNGTLDALIDTATSYVANAPINCISCSLEMTQTATVTVLPALTGTHNETVCFGDSITVNSTVYNAGNLAGTEVFTNIGANSCDSTVTVTLTVLPQLTGTHNETVCFGDSITVNGTVYNVGNLTGTEIFNNIGANNCDSTVAVTLTILPELTGTHNETVCFGDSITVNGTVYNAGNLTGTEIFNNIGANNCDSTVTVTLTILPQLTGTHNETICFGDSITVNGTVYNAGNLTGTEVFNNIGANNCDSTVTVTLTILPQLTSTHNETICFGDSITVNNTVYNASNLTGIEVFTNIGTNNCDSTVAVTLTISNQIDTSTTILGFDITANQAGATYQWIDCNSSNSPILGETNATYTATANGDYAVVVIMGSCSDTTACVNISTVGINVASTQISKIKLYPNPTTGSITISNIESLITKISIVNITGKEIYNLNNISETQLNISLTDFSKGVYFVKIQSDNQLKVIKLIKQ